MRQSLLLLLFLSGCSPRPPEPQTRWYTAQRQMYYNIPVTVKFTPRNDQLAAEVWSYLESIDLIFNDFSETSEIGKLNAAPVRINYSVSPQLAEAFKQAEELHALSGGAFDITVVPLRRLWRAAEKEGHEPVPEALAAARANCGMQKVTLQDGAVTIETAGLKCDFGGLIKGAAVDRVVAMLKSKGVTAALVQMGGETAVFGDSLRGCPHVIGIQDPLDLGRIWSAVADPGGGVSVATSGNYHNPIIIDGREYYHILDPTTGRPVATRVLSVTVVFRETGKNWLADGLSTIGAVMGPEKAIPLVEKLGGETLFLIRDAQGKVVPVQSAGWSELAYEDPAN